jgi:formate dehydrogenase gamma subunit
MTIESRQRRRANREIFTERVFRRFTLTQRWEHGLLILTFTILLLTGLPQKYFQLWGHYIITTPDRLELIRTIHHTTAIVLILEAAYHVVHALILMVRGRLPAAMFPTWKDIVDAWQMIKYLLFLSNEKPEFGKYNFEQKFTYWFLFFGIGIMIVTGFILWFPIVWTRVFPGGTIPAAQLAHSDEAIVATIFLVIWHFYHVHIERLNLSIFTGWLNERDMQRYHELEYKRLAGQATTAEGEAD